MRNNNFPAFISPSFFSRRTGKPNQNLVSILSMACCWQEVFGGADSSVFIRGKISYKRFRVTVKAYWSKTPVERREAVFIFMNTIASRARFMKQVI